ncbi:hypothetical protein MZO42_11725 [Sphingomonas psychrotolerans]|uniref:MotA/TolQ/ExbB proton channel domain-containing protein n=1 Tax=Sphingomonas psychrotolerans TaxID=1327635 RepID=A0ABU3N4H0_9SPHN|nr:hypothetical protein [Sphingomonas psychrotolerans]MDT8759367.1 hypothetical protein [Sphingomonas psychrotolerans]
MPQDEACASKVAEIVKGRKDPAGELIIKVYSYNPPLYAIYRTRDRLIVQFADSELAPLREQQRARIVPLMPMRGQINGLINGWRSANDDGSSESETDGDAEGNREKPEARALGWWGGLLEPRRAAARREQFRKVCRYDRRVADAIITVLEDEANLKLAQELLAQVKNDLIAERTAIARGQYVKLAALLAVGVVALTGLLAAGFFDRLHRFPIELTPVWTAVAGGTIGAFFSVATGLKTRDVVIDLQNRENRIDVMLRMVIGAISGAILYSLFATGLVSTTLFKREIIVRGAEVGPSYSDLTVFLIGFVAGFFERLVPNLLSKTNFGTAEPAGKDTPVQVAPAPGDEGRGGKENAAGAVAEGNGEAAPPADAPAVEALQEDAVAAPAGAADAGAAEAGTVDNPDAAGPGTAVSADDPEAAARPQGA